MDALNNLQLANAYENADLFMAIFVRVLGFIIMLPVFSGRNLPTLIKIQFSLLTAVLMFQTELVNYNYENITIIEYGFVIIKEFAVGISISFIAFLVFSCIHLIGQMIDFQLGLSMASMFDPVSQIQAPITGNLFYYMIILLLIMSKGMHAFIAIMINSYKYIPIGDFSFSFSSETVIFILDIFTKMFESGIKFALPIIGTMILVDFGLGILVKAVPQMNVFVVGMPIKLMLGYFLLIVITPVTTTIYEFIFTNSYKNMLEMIKGLGLSG